MAAQFKIGDQVQLKSGSPKMTVNIVFSDSIECAWFTGSKANKSTFKPDSLEPFKEVEVSSGPKKS